MRGSRQGQGHGCKREPRAPGVTERGSPVMGPKTLPGSESHTGKTRRESAPPLKHRVETHIASAQGSSTTVPWRWRSRGARIRGHIDRGSGRLGLGTSRAGRTARLTFEPARGQVPARWGAEHPPALPAELGRTFVAHAERGLGRLEPPSSISRRASCRPSLSGTAAGSVPSRP